MQLNPSFENESYSVNYSPSWGDELYLTENYSYHNLY